MDTTVEANKALLHRCLTAFGEGDYEPILAAIDDDIVWTSNGPAEMLRFAGTHVGRAAVLAAVSGLAMVMTISRLDVVEMIGEGDVVWVTADVATVQRLRRIELNVRNATRWQLKGGKIVAVAGYFDTASVLLKMGLFKPALRS